MNEAIPRCYPSQTYRHEDIPPRSAKLTKLIYQYFFRGLITALPLGLTIYFSYIFLSWSESVAMQVIRPFIGKFYVPGMGLLLGVTLILLLGF